MARCEWEGHDFPDTEFTPHRGQILLHRTVQPIHLSNGLLPDAGADLSANVDFPGVARGDASVPSGGAGFPAGDADNRTG